MSCSGPFRAMVLGVGLLLVGCADDVGVDANDGADVAPPPDGTSLLTDPVGTTGTNGLSPFEYHPNAGLLDTAMNHPLYDEQGVAPVAKGKAPVNALATLHPHILSLFPTPDGQKTLKYAMRCALPIGTSVMIGNEEVSGGILNSLGAWPTGPVVGSAQNDLFACMAAHLNAFGEEVPIRFAGAAVNNQDGDVSDFTFQEAYWQGGYDPNGVLLYHAWPLPDLQTRCGGLMTSKALNLRVCGNVKGDCGLQVHDDVLADCVMGENGPICLGQPAIKTFLKADDVHKMYRICPTRP